jgi:hypothetical protein
MIADTSYFVAWGTVDPLKNEKPRFGGAGFIEIGNYCIGYGIFYAGNENIGTGFDKPQFHPASDGRG